MTTVITVKYRKPKISEIFEIVLVSIVIGAYLYNSLYRPDLLVTHTANFFIIPNFYTPPMTLIIAGTVGLIILLITRDFHLSFLLIGFSTATWEVMANEFSDFFIWRVISNPLDPLYWGFIWVEFSVLFFVFSTVRIIRLNQKFNYKKVLILFSIAYLCTYLSWVAIPNYSVQGYFDWRTGKYDESKFTSLQLFSQMMYGYLERFFGYAFYAMIPLLIFGYLRRYFRYVCYSILLLKIVSLLLVESRSFLDNVLIVVTVSIFVSLVLRKRFKIVFRKYESLRIFEHK